MTFEYLTDPLRDIYRYTRYDPQINTIIDNLYCNSIFSGYIVIMLFTLINSV